MRRLLTMTLAFCTAATAALADKPMTRHFGGMNSCYERVYSEAHLAKHPQQKVTYMRLDHFPFFSGPFDNNGQPVIYPNARDIVVNLTVHMRGMDVELGATGFCWPEGTGMACGLECDGGQFALVDRAAGKILLRLNNEIYFTDCDAGEASLDPEPDDKVFLLHRLPDTACLPPG